MGSINSPAKSIRNLNFKPLPTRPIEGKLIRVNDTILLRGKNGGLYTNLPVKRNVSCHGRWRWSEDLTHALEMLGVLTEEDRTAHLAYLESEKEREDARDTCYRAKEAQSAGLTPNVKVWNAAWEKLTPWEQSQYSNDAPPGAAYKPKPEVF